MVLTGGLTDGSASAEGDVGEEGRVGFRGFRGEAVPVYQRALIEERCAKVDHWSDPDSAAHRAHAGFRPEPLGRGMPSERKSTRTKVLARLPARHFTQLDQLDTTELKVRLWG